MGMNAYTKRLPKRMPRLQATCSLGMKADMRVLFAVLYSSLEARLLEAKHFTIYIYTCTFYMHIILYISTPKLVKLRTAVVPIK
jgi:hypothetical protein